MSLIRRGTIRQGVVPIESWSPSRAKSRTIRYIDISSVGRESKTITIAEIVSVDSAPSRARQVLRTNDVIVSTVRPSLNAVAVVPSELDGAIASTGFTVLRSKPDILEPRYLLYWMRHPAVVEEMTRKATGASYPAVSDRVVLDLFIPMPSIGQQHRIADLLDKADAIRRKRREALALTGDLLRSVFLDMFGDPVANPRGWDTTTLGSLAKDVRYGTSEKCSVNQTPDSRPVLRIPNVAEGEIRWVDLKFASIESPEAERLALDRGDLLFVRSNGNPEYIARCAVYESDRPAVFASYLIRVRLERNEFPTYVQAALSMPSYRSVLTRAARTTAGNYNISSEGLRDLRLPIPPSDRIARFGAVRSGIARERQLLQAAEAESERLFFALVHQSFCEE